MSKAFSDKLRQTLKRKKMTQKELARRSGLHPATISNYARNMYEPPDDAKRRIALALGESENFFSPHSGEEKSKWWDKILI